MPIPGAIRSWPTAGSAHAFVHGRRELAVRPGSFCSTWRLSPRSRTRARWIVDSHDLFLEPIEVRVLLAVGLDLVLIDRALPHADAVVRAARPGAVVVGFDAGTDSAADVLRRAAGLAIVRNNPLRSISVVSHGGAGFFQLGAEQLSAANLHDTEAEWRSLARRMTPDAEVALLGCD